MARIIAETSTPKFSNDYDGDLYITLLESIVSQQISTKAADAIFARVRALFRISIPMLTRFYSKRPKSYGERDYRFKKLNTYKVWPSFHWLNPTIYRLCPAPGSTP